MYRKKFEVISIRNYLEEKEDGGGELKREISDFSCPLNLNVERFLKEQAIEFTKKNQSVTYLVFSKEDASLVGYFTLAVKPLIIKEGVLSKTMQKKILRIGEYSNDNCTIHLAAFLIAQLGKNFTNNANQKITGQELLKIAIAKLKEVQHTLGGMVVFLEMEENSKLYEFYQTKNSFKKFDTREAVSMKNHRLVQMIKTL